VADPADWPVVVTAGERGTVQVWDLSARSTVGGLPGHTNTVTDAATASADGRTLAVTGSRDHTARVWDMTAGTTRTVLEGHRGPITSVAMAVVAGQPVALTGSTDRTARVWDAASGRTTAVFTRHTEPVTGVGLAVLHERPFAVTAAADGTVQVWDVAVRRAVRVIAQEVQAMDVVVVGDRLAAVFATASGADWHPDLGADRAATVPLDRDAPAVTAVAATMLGGLPVAVTGNSEGAVRVWDLSNPREATVIEGHTDGVTDIATLVRGDTTWAITTGYDCTARVWDLANGRCLTTLALPDVPHSVGIGPEGHIVLGMGHEVIALTLTPAAWRLS
jgi:WD40 repeat protein